MLPRNMIMPSGARKRRTGTISSTTTQIFSKQQSKVNPNGSSAFEKIPALTKRDWSSNEDKFEQVEEETRVLNRVVQVVISNHDF
jgi:hypothetical protein